MADAGGASRMLPVEAAAAAPGEPRRRAGFARTRNAGDSGKRDSADAGRADAARGDGRTLAAVPPISRAAFLRDAGAALCGSSQGVGAGGGLDWVHAAEVHRTAAAATR